MEIDPNQSATHKEKGNNMEQQWDEFSKSLKNRKEIMKAQGNSKFHTPQQTQRRSNLETGDNQETSSQEVEIIPALLTSEITFKIEKIPPLDVFYSLEHKVVLR